MVGVGNASLHSMENTACWDVGVRVRVCGGLRAGRMGDGRNRRLRDRGVVYIHRASKHTWQDPSWLDSLRFWSVVLMKIERGLILGKSGEKCVLLAGRRSR